MLFAPCEPRQYVFTVLSRQQSRPIGLGRRTSQRWFAFINLKPLAPLRVARLCRAKHCNCINKHVRFRCLLPMPAVYVTLNNFVFLPMRFMWESQTMNEQLAASFSARAAAARQFSCLIAQQATHMLSPT